MTRKRSRRHPPACQCRNCELGRVMAKLDAQRMTAGQCRHCGGAVPCWSYFGDVAIGVAHTDRDARKDTDHDG